MYKYPIFSKRKFQANYSNISFLYQGFFVVVVWVLGFFAFSIIVVLVFPCSILNKLSAISSHLSTMITFSLYLITKPHNSYRSLFHHSSSYQQSFDGQTVQLCYTDIDPKLFIPHGSCIKTLQEADTAPRLNMPEQSFILHLCIMPSLFRYTNIQSNNLV